MSEFDVPLARNNMQSHKFITVDPRVTGPRRAPAIGELEWARYYNVIVDMHNNGTTRDEMLQILRETRNFRPTPTQLYNRLRKWGLSHRQESIPPGTYAQNMSAHLADSVANPPSDETEQPIVATIRLSQWVEETVPPWLALPCYTTGRATASDAVAYACGTPDCTHATSDLKSLEDPAQPGNSCGIKRMIWDIAVSLKVFLVWRSPSLQMCPTDYMHGVALLADLLSMSGAVEASAALYTFLSSCLTNMPKGETMQIALVAEACSFRVGPRNSDPMSSNGHDMMLTPISRATDLITVPKTPEVKAPVTMFHIWYFLQGFQAPWLTEDVVRTHATKCGLLLGYMQRLRAWLIIALQVPQCPVLVYIRNLGYETGSTLRLLHWLFGLWSASRRTAFEDVMFACTSCGTSTSPAALYWEQRIIMALVIAAVSSLPTHDAAVPAAVGVHPLLRRLHQDALASRDGQWASLTTGLMRNLHLSWFTYRPFDACLVSPLELALFIRDARQPLGEQTDLLLSEEVLVTLRNAFQNPVPASTDGPAIFGCMVIDEGVLQAKSSQVPMPVPSGHMKATSSTNSLKSLQRNDSTNVNEDLFHMDIGGFSDIECEDAHDVVDTMTNFSDSSEQPSMASFRKLAERIQERHIPSLRSTSNGASMSTSMRSSSTWSFDRVTGYRSVMARATDEHSEISGMGIAACA